MELEIKDFYKEKLGSKITLQGRITSIRESKNICFYTLQDDTDKCQLTSRKHYKLLNNYDYIKVCGIVIKTKTDHLTLEIEKLEILAKCNVPLPRKKERAKKSEIFVEKTDIIKKKEITDGEILLRQRYLYLIFNIDVYSKFKIRHQLISYLRNYFDSRSYIEVETPILHKTPSGANANPFKLADGIGFLRIAPELYLKQLIIGGFKKIYEIGKQFRNESSDKTHNPEFTSIEFYEIDSNYLKMMELVEDLLSNLVYKLFGTYIIEYNAIKLNFEKPFKKINFVDELKKIFGMLDKDHIMKQFEKDKKFIPEPANIENLLEKASEYYIEDKIVNPTFVIGHPSIISPLAKSKPDDKDISERFELFINNMEICNAYSELTDVEEQRKKFGKQLYIDEDFCKALEYGMPTVAGCGIGIDRLVMLLTNSNNIKDIILFPT